MRYLISTMICLSATGAIAQLVAPYQLKDPDAIRINDKIISLLTSQKWACHKRSFVMYNEGKTYSISYSELTLDRNGVCHHGKLTGRWKIEGEKLLVLEYDSIDFTRDNVYFAGGFSIHYADADEVILVKNLTTDFDNRIAYYLKNKEGIDKSMKDDLADRIQRNPILKTANPKIESTSEKGEVNVESLRKHYSEMSLQELRSLFVNEAFQRRVNIVDMSKDQLIEWAIKTIINK